MDAFLQLSMEERRLACQQVDARMQLQAVSVEKDLWVCWTLRELFTLPGIGDHLTFKGGTSLSKAWKLIRRFSEDIDLVVDKEVLGFGGEADPEAAPSKGKRRDRLDGLMAACRAWVQEKLLPALTERIRSKLGAEGWSLEVDPGTPDGQCLLLHYPSAFPTGAAGYVRPVVKVELGARSDVWPSDPRTIEPYVAEIFPALVPNAAFEVPVLATERTFWEKACLLHEETFRPIDKPRKVRMARHYYDLWCLIDAGVGERALVDKALFQRVAAHRELFFRQTWVDYTTHKAGTFRLVPSESQMADWRADFEQMLGPMFWGSVPDFDEILRVVADFERRFNDWTSPATTGC